MVLKLYGNPISPCTKRVAMVLHEKHVPFELVPIDFTKGEHKRAAFVAVQPFGQVPYLDDDGFITITGRKKELIVTAGGKNVAPGPLEDEIRKPRLIGNAVVLGEGKRFISALVTVDPDELKKWAAENDKEGQTPQQLVADKGLRAEVQYAIDDANALVSHAEGIKKFTVLPKDFSEDGGELTATMKVKRHVVEEKYADEIAEIYGD